MLDTEQQRLPPHAATARARRQNARDLTWRFYEWIKDGLDCLKAEPLIEAKLRDRRELAEILIQRSWINK